MNILVIGTAQNLEECKLKFGEQHTYFNQDNHQNSEQYFAQANVIFDFEIHQHIGEMEVYRDHPKAIAFLNTTCISLHQLLAKSGQPSSTNLFGFCGLPTFLNRSVLEVSLFEREQEPQLERLCFDLKTDYSIVDDRVGLVTPRVICMIINEAYYTVQEGTASKEDIDQAMKLGTNYPFGPFEWSKRIGLSRVHETLQSLYEDSGDERYKICSLLKKEALGEQING